ncbi:DUF3331 domain-containing protein [Paraburkholderia sp. ZP32-5]|uniref:DUF3331 domain-containing protein n=1 Tax=Paraburkholderia sp. ZP32-5 TaxID=2883245 RepID=UPI001F41DCDF|nr:DUF3331 domain-containing protein [Paraburkholderia sp. ZP32-5]
MAALDPWPGIVYWLVEERRLPRPVTQKISPRPQDGYRECPMRTSTGALVIIGIELQANATLLVSWSDPTLGRFVDQRWRPGSARMSGTCRLTGKPVRRGDRIFRPQLRNGTEPPNASDMILVASVHDLSTPVE